MNKKSAAINGTVRRYRIAFFEGTVLYDHQFNLSDLLSNEGEFADTELFYTLSEEIDEILDIRLCEVFVTQFKRDGENRQAIITRLK
jgi:hypothetical protein